MRRIILAALVLAACGGDSTGPESRVPQVGRYAYSATVAGVAITGTLHITSATSSEVDGYWSVPAYDDDLLMGDWNITAYLVWARTNDGQLHNHRVARRGGEYSCEGVRPLWEDGALESRPFACTLSYVGP